MKGIGFKIIPIILIGLFIFVMTSGSLLKKPMFGDDDVAHYIHNVKESVHDKSWKTASKNLNKAQKAWKKVIPRIQFSVERDEMNMFGKKLERTQAFISAKEKGSALAELAEAQYLWKEFGK
ncbi:DUF4363 family protein [Virgibacillus sp. FSP13]